MGCGRPFFYIHFRQCLTIDSNRLGALIFILNYTYCMKILQNHFTVSWQIAVHNCKLILDGLIDSTQQKLFVSSFQNAIELGCKQIMIDECDYRIIDFGPKKCDISLAKQFLVSTDLNSFFGGLASASLSKLFSIEFNEIIDIFSEKIKLEKGINIKDQLNILKKLRNDETHFYIDLYDYLTFGSFKKLCELLDFFFDYFVEKNVLDRKWFGKSSDDSDDQLIYFNLSDYSLHSYRDLVKQSKTNLLILKSFPLFDKNDTLNGEVLEFKNAEDIYSVAYSIFNSEWKDDRKDYYVDFYEFYRRFQILEEEKLIHIEQNYACGFYGEDEYGHEYWEEAYEIAIVTRTYPHN